MMKKMLKPAIPDGLLEGMPFEEAAATEKMEEYHFCGEYVEECSIPSLLAGACRFTNMTFADCRFEKASFTDVIFEKCDLSNSNFTGSYFAGWNLKTAA